ncbi:MAG: hypothetical protein AMXMBFR64_24640 [Myxococcales bacterium]
MSRLTASQRARLGLFLLVAAFLLVSTIGLLVGVELFRARDPYFINFNQSVSGLEAGAPVKYNGVAVGRVERVGINPDDVTQVQVHITVDGGTPIKRDTKAVLNMQGITGLKFIELIGGTNEAGSLELGGRIEAELSTLDMLADQAGVIVRKVDVALANLIALTGPDNQRRLATTLSELEEVTRQVNRLVAIKSKDIDRVMTNVALASDELPGIISETRDTVAAVRDAVGGLRAHLVALIDPAQVRGVLERADSALARIDKAAATLDARLGKQELGAAIASYTKLADRSTQLVDNADVTLLRARDDLLKALDVLVIGVESFAEFATTLRDDPSALIGGRRLQERSLP